MSLDLLRGFSNGSVDSARVLFLIGGIAVIFAPIGFEVWAMIRHQTWDVAAFCIAYGGLLTGYIIGGGFGIATKDKGVATANAIAPSAGSDS